MPLDPTVRLLSDTLDYLHFRLQTLYYEQPEFKAVYDAMKIVGKSFTTICFEKSGYDA